MSPRYAALTLAIGILLAPLAASALDSPSVSLVTRGHGKAVIDVTAGPSGLPNGFAMYWMKYSDYEDYGAVWPDLLSYPGLGWAFFTGIPTLNTFGSISTYKIGPGQTVRVEVGDLADEDGAAVNTNSPVELDSGTEYVLCAFAISASNARASSYSPNAQTILTSQGDNCTFTVGYWKNHGPGACNSGGNPDVWPAGAFPMLLGTVVYTQAQICSILNQPVAGNGLISLAHQLIAAKLNIVNGADGTSIAGTIAAADALIGGLVVPPVGGGYLSPASTAAYTQALDDYNQGITGPGHCAETPSHRNTWGRVKSLYR